MAAPAGSNAGAGIPAECRSALLVTPVFRRSQPGPAWWPKCTAVVATGRLAEAIARISGSLPIGIAIAEEWTSARAMERQSPARRDTLRPGALWAPGPAADCSGA
jgi:hypothetical protein